MIRRDAENGFWLITQHDHALLSGELARCVGGAFLKADEVTIQGIANHDCGWPLHDDEPTLNKDGLPLHVFESPVAISTRVWSASVERAKELGEYQGLLVSLHALNLSSLTTTQALSRPDLFELNKFQHRQIEIQEELRGRLGLSNEVPRKLGLARAGASVADDRLLFHFRLLTAMDRLSLALCCGTNLFPNLDDVIPRPGNAPMPITVEMPDPGKLLLDPWPFDPPALQFQIRARAIRKQPFAALEPFRQAYREAPVQSLTLGLGAADRFLGTSSDFAS